MPTARVLRRPRVALAAGAVALGVLAPLARAAGPAPTPADPLPGNSALPQGWTLAPAGTQVLTQRGPTGLTVSPDGSHVYAVTSGIFDEAVENVDASTLTATPTLVDTAFQGVAADAAGDVWVSGGAADKVFQYRAVGPTLLDERAAGPAPSTPSNGIPVTGYPGTMLLSGHLLFVAGTLSVPSKVAGGCPLGQGICSVVSVLDVSDPSPTTTPPTHQIAVGRDAYGLAYSPATETLYVSNWADGTRAAGATGTVSVVHVNPDGSGAQTQRVPVGDQPMGVALAPDGRTLAVADSADDTVSLLSLGADGSVTGTRTVSVAVAVGAPTGTTPVALTYTPDGRYLLVALAGLNAVEVLHADGGAIPQRWPDGVTGHQVHSPASYLPTGWYPDALALGPQPSGAPGSRLYVANLNGGGAGPGYYGQLEPVVGSSTEGSISAIDLPPTGAAFDGQLAHWTAQVVANDRLAAIDDPHLPDPGGDACTPATLPDGSRVLSGLLCSAQQGGVDPHPLHVVEILAENKTFDSYFGDTLAQFPTANADPGYTEYGQAVTTNQHHLAAEYALSDNFWNEGAESSVLGHSWWSAGNVTPDNMLTWGADYGQGLRGNRGAGQYGPPDLASGNPSSVSLSGPRDAAVARQESLMLAEPRDLVDEVLAAGLTARVYGTDLAPGSAAAADQVPQGLWGEGPNSPVSSDLGMPDVDRARIFLHGQTVSHAWDLFDGPTPPATFGQTVGYPKGSGDYDKFTFDAWVQHYASCRGAGGSDSACQQAMPNFVYLDLPENHTYDVSNVFNPLDPTPQSMVADNDMAIGMILDALSHSPFWKNTAVFLSEDDNQFTGDHVDIHRTFLLAAGGLVRQLGPAGRVDDQQASFPSVLKTIEVLLGLPPLSLYDWQAVPLQDLMQVDPSTRTTATYTAVTPLTPFLSNVDPANPTGAQPVANRPAATTTPSTTTAVRSTGPGSLRATATPIVPPR